ncbi:hypothetical protein KEU06_08810 [Pseudaminobacter sp. 19-2017]|uniref:Uncharacterized protein n=1 Tax=Pseudaminobacter soli (ex Zhang et al. 2022) TaxID=2831468 RepID=A0A942E058_9HYPH|nr:hypothetical protein [Pseudaminobacter soli]MBS3648728.1 hypothetical protein [Pseudaminobacter soli]
MKTTATPNTRPYPILKRLCVPGGLPDDPPHVVMFTGPRTGVTLTTTVHGRAGVYSDTLIPECWKDFYGTITIES